MRPALEPHAFMILAAISFSDPLMLIGLLAAGIPVLLHLLNRIRSPIVPFPTLRFLKITAQKTSRRRQLQQWFLLLIRMIVFAMVAMVIAGPFIGGGSSFLAYGFIVLLLVGATLLMLAGAMAVSALDRRQAVAPTQSVRDALAGRRPHTSVASPMPSLLAAAVLVLLGLLGAGYSVYGLASDRYFNASAGKYTGRSTACVIIYDNSQSMLARQDSLSRLDRARREIHNLLSGDLRPAEVAVLPTNPGTTPVADYLTTDLTTTLGQVDKLEPVGKARSMKQLVRQAMMMLTASGQPTKMLVIVSDLAYPTFSDPEIFGAIKDSKIAKDLRVVLMPQARGTPADVGITQFTVASGQPVAGNEVMFEATLINNGDAASVADLQLLVDGQPAEGIQPRVQLGAAGAGDGKAGGAAGGGARTSVKLAYRLKSPGYHTFTVALRDQADAMEWDNRRSLILNVANQLQVLVIGPEPKIRPRSTAHFVDAALDPFAGAVPNVAGAGGDKGPTWSIKPTYKGVDAIAGQSLAGNAAVFLCDVPKAPPALVNSLVAYANAGGRIVLVLGPSVDPAAYNTDLGGRGLLAGSLSSPVVTASGSALDWVDTESDIFANLFDTQEPFRNIVVTGRWPLTSNAAQKGRPLAKLADGSTFITQHTLGKGEIYTVYTAPGGGWSNMATSVAFLPMLSRMAMGDSGRMRSEVAYQPGDVVELPVLTDDRTMGVDVTTPRGETINVRPLTGSVEHPAWRFAGTLTEGAYSWTTVDRKTAGRFYVNPPGDEADLVPTDADALARTSPTAVPAIVAPTAQDVAAALNRQAEGTSLAPGVIAFVLILSVFEALLANRYRPAARSTQLPGGVLPEPAAPAAARPAA